MANPRLTAEERETVIIHSEVDSFVTIDTSIRRDITQCQNKGYQLMGVSGETYRFKCSKACISFRTEKTGDTPKRVLSEEHKAKLMAARAKSHTN